MSREAFVVGAAAVLGVVAALIWPREQVATPKVAVPKAASRGSHAAAAARAAGRAPAARRPAPPAIEVVEGPVVHDPEAVGYDPTKLSHMGIPSREIFAREPRDPQWAPAMERRIRARLAHDLGVIQPSARATSVECRMSTCRMIIEAPEDLSGATQSALQFLGNADTHAMVDAERADDGSVRLTMDGLFTREHRNLDDNDAHYEQFRAAVLRQAVRDNDPELLPLVAAEAGEQ